MKNRQMKTSLVALLFIFVSLGVFSSMVYAHCQIPCGIYDDHARVELMFEDSAIILKTTKLIKELFAKTDVQSQN